jgi:hypothetical protein
MNYVDLGLKVITLISSLLALARAHQERGAGFAEAVNQALVQTDARVTAAKEELENAERIHNSDPTDGAFNSEFRRD